VTALPDGLVGWWRRGGPGRIRALFIQPPVVATYPDLELDPTVQAEKAEMEGGAP
jgi:urea transport system permease protein